MTLREDAWEDRLLMTTPRWTLALLLAASLATAGGGLGLPASASTGRADLQLVRLLSGVPDSIRARSEQLHDLRVRLVPGNVVLFRKGGEFAALLPIESAEAGFDSLRYFYYVEKPSTFWIIPGARTKGILTVSDGGALRFNSFRLIWGKEGSGAGWLYFPESRENQGLRFSVVSGRSVDKADPKGTKYWVELGNDQPSGF